MKGIYAIGDMAGPPLLAHKAMAEGVVAAEAHRGAPAAPVDYGNVPSLHLLPSAGGAPSDSPRRRPGPTAAR